MGRKLIKLDVIDWFVLELRNTSPVRGRKPDDDVLFDKLQFVKKHIPTCGRKQRHHIRVGFAAVDRVKKHIPNKGMESVLSDSTDILCRLKIRNTSPIRGRKRDIEFILYFINRVKKHLPQ